MTGILKYLKHVTFGFLVMLPLVAAYGFLFPWPAGERVLGRFPGQTPIMVAEYYHSKSWTDRRSHGWVTSKSESRSYILFPSVFRNPRIVTVSQTNEDAPVVSESRIPFILLALAGAIALGALGIGQLSTRPSKRYRLTAQDAKTFYGPRLPHA